MHSQSAGPKLQQEMVTFPTSSVALIANITAIILNCLEKTTSDSGKTLDVFHNDNGNLMISINSDFFSHIPYHFWDPRASAWVSFAISKLSSPHAHVVVSTPFKDDLNNKYCDVFCLWFPYGSMEESSGEP